jgi:hypothetical protein
MEMGWCVYMKMGRVGEGGGGGASCGWRWTSGGKVSATTLGADRYGSFDIGNETKPYDGTATVRVTGVKSGSTVVVDQRCVLEVWVGGWRGRRLCVCVCMCVCVCVGKEGC